MFRLQRFSDDDTYLYDTNAYCNTVQFDTLISGTLSVTSHILVLTTTHQCKPDLLAEQRQLV